MTTITRIYNGFIITGTSTYIVTFRTINGEPTAYFREESEPLDTIVTTKHPRGLWYFMYHMIRHEARWNPEMEWE